MVLLVGAFVGVVAGALMLMLGDSPDAGSLSAQTGSGPAPDADSSERGTAVLGTSLIAAGLGLGLLVAGILVRPKAQARSVVPSSTATRPPQ